MISSAINNLIADLKPRQREIIVGRFGLEDNERETLAQLGERYDVTRERVRQIEAEAINRIREEAKKEHLKRIVSRLFEHLDNFGGLRREDFLIQELREFFKDEDLHFWHLKFLSLITDQPHHYLGDDECHSFWYLEEKVLKAMRKFVAELGKLIAAKKEDLIFRGKFADYLKRVTRYHNISEQVGLNYISISKKFGVNPFGDFGLNHWEEINPKTIGSKTYLILKKQSQPLHFREITESINKLNFDEKKALPQTVHNELIKDPRFVLVGRGTYGLREHGFVPGTARDIITQILKKEGSLSLDKVLELVSKQRLLEKNTIILNLQNKTFFKKMPDGRYAIIRSRSTA